MSRDLLGPTRLRGLALPNRVVMAPMTRARATTTVPDDLTARYYQQRAGAGLIISEGAPVSLEGNGWLFTPGLHTQEQVAGWQRVTDAVRGRQGRIFAQLWHVGRGSHVSLQADGRAPVSSTAQDGDTTYAYRSDGSPGFIAASTPRALGTDEIPRLVEDFATAAANAYAAGFHGVEIHGATRYLFEQFLNAGFNTRQDRYGARTLADRLRLILEVLDAVIGRVGAARVGVRLSPYSTIGGMPVDDKAEETYLALARQIAAREVAYIHIHDTAPISALAGVDIDAGTHSSRIRDLLAAIRPDLGETAVMLAGGLTRQSAQHLLDTGFIDLAAFGRPFISNPDLVERFRGDAALAEADPGTFYAGGPEGYTDYLPAPSDRDADRTSGVGLAR